jgi:hypothetical protein
LIHPRLPNLNKHAWIHRKLEDSLGFEGECRELEKINSTAIIFCSQLKHFHNSEADHQTDRHKEPWLSHFRMYPKEMLPPRA